jgi:predicted transcriptional regulator
VANYRAGKPGKHPRDTRSPQQKLLIDILLNPFSGVTKRYKRLNLNPKYGNKFKNLLISQGCIQPNKIITAKGWITLFQLTQKGKIVLRDLGYDISDTGEGIVHRFWKYKISEYYKSKNLNVAVEKTINGRPDIIVENHTTKAAIEIETGRSDFISNIRRNLEAGFDEVICVAASKEC